MRQGKGLVFLCLYLCLYLDHVLIEIAALLAWLAARNDCSFLPLRGVGGGGERRLSDRKFCHPERSDPQGSEVEGSQ